MKLLRVPSVSRLQKVHNVDIALSALRRGGAEIRKEITAKDLVDGHREKTLELLWSIIFGYQLAAILDLDKIKEEIIHLKRSLAAKSRLGEAVAQSGQSWLRSLASRSPVQTALAGERLELLLHWVRLVLVHYGVEIENWTTSWCDGRALCLLVHHYQPSLLARDDIRDSTTLTHQADNQNLDDSLDFCYGSKEIEIEVARIEKKWVDMEREIFKTVRETKASQLKRKVFFVAHFNYLCEARGEFPPCEASVISFSLEGGLLNTWQGFVSPLDSVPVGFRFMILKRSRSVELLGS